MAKKRQFKMVPVSTAICAAGGYTAQFTDQEEAKDALEFMPAILRNAGIRLDQAIFAKFCRRVFEKMVEHTAKTGEWATWTKVMTSRLYILAPFEKATFTVRSRAGNPEGQPQKKEISATVKYADLVFERVKSNVVLVGGG